MFTPTVLQEKVVLFFFILESILWKAFVAILELVKMLQLIIRVSCSDKIKLGIQLMPIANEPVLHTCFILAHTPCQENSGAWYTKMGVW